MSALDASQLVGIEAQLGDRRLKLTGTPGAFRMTYQQARRAPFSWIQTEDYVPKAGKQDKRDVWLEDAMVRLVIDQHGDVFQLLRGGIDPDKLIEELNFEAARLIMAEGTPAFLELNQEK